MSLPELQSRVATWHRSRWPSCPLPVLAAKLAEECGEVSAEVVAKWESMQGPREGMTFYALDGLAQELAQVVVVSLALAARAGVNLSVAVAAEVARLEAG